jgi:hypothetical protein
MAVYVDEIETWPKYVTKALGRKLGARWCHMIADSDEELHEMAKLIGVTRGSWYKEGSAFTRYDLTPQRRTLALACGAIEIDRLKLAQKAIAQRREG